MNGVSVNVSLLARLSAGILLAAAGLAHAQDVDALVGSARSMAGANRNPQSAALFAQAIALAPERRREWLREYAEQLTYSQQAVQAVPLFQEILGSGPARAERLRALKGLGLALSWSDQNDAARQAYETLLQEDPADPSAQRDLGRVLSWGGRQREAEAVLRQFLASHPNDGEALFLLAQAQWWQGRPDAARATLAQLRGQGGGQQALGLDLLLRESQRPAVRLDVQRSTQSDHLDISRTTAEYQWTAGDGLTSLAPRWQRTSYRPQGGAPIRVDQPGLRLRHRFQQDMEVNGEFGVDNLSVPGQADARRFVYSAWWTVWPGDSWRFDLSSKRETFDNVLSLQRGITANSVGISADWTPNERSKLSLRASDARYSDTNQRRFGQFELERRLGTHPSLWGGLRVTHVGFSQLLGNGYFNPLRFDSAMLTLRADSPAPSTGSGWSWSARLAGGREYAHPDGDKPAYEIGLTGGYALTPDARLELRIERFDSTLAAGGGFARTTAGLALVVKPGAQ